MSILSHAVCGAKGLEAARRNLDNRIQAETAEAKRIQQQTGCTWAEALRLAYKQTEA